MARWKVPIAVAFAIGMLMPIVRGQEPHKSGAGSPKPMPLTAMDYVEIRQLVSRYAFAVDTGNNNGYDYADLFSADGEFMRPYARGREQLAALARGGRLGPANTVHYIMNHVIEPTPDGAIGKEYLIELNWDLNAAGQNGRGQDGQGGRGQNARGQGAPAQAGRGQGGGQGNGGQGGFSQWDLIGRKAGELARTGGHYEDIYVKTPVGWRFKKRDFIPSKSGHDAAPLAPPRIPADAAQQEAAGPLAPAANFIPPTQQSSLTAMDYIEIAQLVSSYGHALDSGYGKGENGEAYANLYTPDAAFAGAVGHDQLVRLAQIQPRGPDFVRHYLTNHVIEPTPEGAKGKEYLIVIDNGQSGKPSSLFLGGHYEDTYVKTADGWRFKTRRLFPPRSGPQPQVAVGAPPKEGLAAVPPDAAQKPTKSSHSGALAAMDYVEIQQLVARYGYALDTAAENGEAYARLFTPDGVLSVKTAQPYGIRGRAQLAAYAEGDLPHRGPFYVRDYVTNHIIHPSPEGATGRVYVVWIEVGENGNPGIVQSGGHYDDVYVKSRDGWRIKTRTFVPSKLGAREVFEPPPAQ
jgi:hypothetical protein